MTDRKHRPLNPYIAGSALDGPGGFFGREDILRLVETELRSPHKNAVVLFGQRRIGKASILLQLRRRLSESGFLSVYMDLMDRARRPLGTTLGSAPPSSLRCARWPRGLPDWRLLPVQIC